MDLDTFIRLYEGFLAECEQKGWTVEIMKEEVENHFASIKNMEGMEVQFYIKVDFENYLRLSDTTNESIMDYGVVRPERDGDLFAKEVLKAFDHYLEQHAPKLH